MFEIKRYTADRKAEWNHFVGHSKNGTFLFNRNYMDYHSDRFSDSSLMIYQGNRLAALLPLNRTADGQGISHQGLTYGGLILDHRATTKAVIEMFDKINRWLAANTFHKVIYKAIPWIYHRMPAEEDLYALFNICNAQLTAREISSTIVQRSKTNFSESRKSGIRKATAAGIQVKQSSDYAAFWHILSNNLANRYNAAPVHSLQEITLLSSLFPDNIKLFMAYLAGTAVGGTVIYETPQAIHTQYISASPAGKAAGALDMLFCHLINYVYKDVPYFDFGKSTQDNGSSINHSLIFQKEGFGARGLCYDTYEWQIQPNTTP